MNFLTENNQNISFNSTNYSNDKKENKVNIVIFGWFGASQKNLSKYENLFNDLGAKNVYIHQSNIKKCITYSGWKEMRNNPPAWANQDIDLAVMFSGGVFPYVNYRIANSNFKPKKLIFDSGIFFPTPDQTSNYIKHILPLACRRVFPTSVANRSIKTLWGVQQYNWKERLAEFEQQISCNAEKLIINSKDDRFIIRSQLEGFLNRYTGGNISEYLFERSGHVQHYKNHPKEYINVVKDFIHS